MEMEGRSVNMCTSVNCKPTKCLLFDRRYGWVIDVWKEPSEDALSGGRGMFCIVPLAKALVKATSQTINLAASSTLEVLEKPELISPEALQVHINYQLQRIMSSMKKPVFDLALLKRSQTFSFNLIHGERNE